MAIAVATCVALPSAAVIAVPVMAGELSDCPDGWQPMAVAPVLAGGGPQGAAQLAGQPAWMVGRFNSLASIAAWDGSSWMKIPAPWTTDTGLTAVSTYSPTAAWAVGFGRIFQPGPIATRWNGTAWNAIAVPQPKGEAAFIDVVALGPKRAVAVGSRLASGRLVPYVMFRNKKAWVDHSPSLAPAIEGGLTSVTKSDDGTIWTAGWRTVSSTPQPWIAYWSGTAWVEAPTADVAGNIAFLNDMVFSSATDGWAVGYMERGQGGYAPILERWNGVDWQLDPLPWDADSSAVLTTVAVDATGRLFVAGQKLTNAGPSAVMAVNESGTWTEAPPRNDPYPGSWSQKAVGLDDGAFVTGFFGPTAQVFRSCDMVPPPRPGVGEGPDATGSGPRFVEDVEGSPPAGGNAPAIGPQPLPGFEAVDVTDAAGLTLSSATYGGVAEDFNGDGWTDVFINRHGEDVPYYLLGGPDGFAAPDSASFQFTDRHLCAAADVNDDTALDLFCTVGRRQGTAMGANELLLDVGETGGTVAAQEFGLLDATGRGRAAAFVHLEADPLPDLVVVSEPVRLDGLPSFNRFYRNVDGTHFEPAPDVGLDTSAGGVCAVATNLDADADDELLVCTVAPIGSVKAGLHVFDFNGARFVDKTLAWGLKPSSALAVAVADFNGDSLPDIAQLGSGLLRVSLANGSGGFSNAFERKATNGTWLATGDVNGDLRPDIYVTRQTTPNGNLMLVNNGSGTGFAEVLIPQPGGNVDYVMSLDYDHNGLTDFLTLHGVGAVNLTAWFPNTP